MTGIVSCSPDSILELVKIAEEDVILAAPYIKAHVLEIVMRSLSPKLKNFVCITRWQPQDVAAGVSDLEIFDLVSGLSNGQLLICPFLHAKYYRGDSNCLLGSSNLTGRALGWVFPSNLEILVALNHSFAGLKGWEASLLKACFPATAALKEQVARAALALRSKGVAIAEPSGDPSVMAKTWVPVCPAPDRLWSVYTGDLADITQNVRETAIRDLAILSVPAYLTAKLFKTYVGGALLRSPIFLEIERLSQDRLSDEKAQAYLKGTLEGTAPYPIEDTWRVMKQWIGEFLKSDYHFESAQDVLVKGQQIE